MLVMFLVDVRLKMSH